MTPSRAEAPVVLDSFLGALLPACDGAGALDAFRRSLAARYGHDATGKRVKPGAPVVVPPEIRPALGPVVAVNKGEYTEVAVPLAGRFRSLPVRGITFLFGNENGIDTTILRFGAPRAAVAGIIGRDVARGSRLIRKRVQAGDTGADQSISLDETGGDARLVCDTSN